MFGNRILAGALIVAAFAQLPAAEAAAPPISAQPPLQATNLERSFIFRGLLYSLQGNDLAVVSVRNPGATLSVYRSGAYVRRIDGAGAYVLVANDVAGLRVLNYANPSRPVMVRRLPASRGYAARFVKVIGTRAFVTERPMTGAGPWNLRIYDVSNPAQPALRQIVSLGSGGGYGAVAPLGPAHVAVGAGGDVKIVYVGTPRAFIRSRVASASPSGMATKGRRLYLSRGCGRFGCGYSFVEIWDLANAARPVLLKRHRVSWYTYSENAVSIAQIGSRTVLFLNLTDGASQEVLGLLDVTTPAQPRALTFLRLRHPSGWWLIPADVDVFGNTAWVWGWRPPHFPPGYEYFTTRIDVSDPANPRIGPMIQIPPR